MYQRNATADRRMAETPLLLAYLPRILLYPVSGHALPALLMFSVFLWFGLQSIFGVAMVAITAPWVFHYAEAVIDRTANGQSTPPQFGGDMVFLGGLRALEPLIGLGLLAVAWIAVRDQGPGPQIAVLAAGAFLFPGYMLVFTVEKSVLAALNPLQLIPAIIRVGPVYLAVCFILSLSAAAVVLVASQSGLFVALFVAIYLWLMSFHLLGYVTFHRAARLGMSLKTPPPTNDSRRMEQQQARLATVVRKIDAALASKDLAAAGKALYAEVGGPADVRLFHEELFEQLQVLSRRKVELIHAQGQRLISQLIREKRLARALDIAETCFDQHLDFAPEQPAQAVMLAETALQLKRDGLFERLTHDAAKRYSRDAAAVSLLFLRAKFWCERRQDDAKAREILESLLGESGHPLYRQIAALAKALGPSP